MKTNKTLKTITFIGLTTLMVIKSLTAFEYLILVFLFIILDRFEINITINNEVNEK